MKDLNFYGPFHFNDFTENGIFKKYAPNKYSINDELGNTLNIPDLNQPGIYIWGNLFDIDSKQKLLHPTDCTINNFKYNPKKHQFIPYYVGKIESSLFNRLTKHKNVRHGDGTKYIRFSFDYWKEFFKDADFHRESPFLIDIVSKNKNSIKYHNDKEVLRLIYPDMEITSIPSRKDKDGEQKYDHPITEQIIDGVLLPDNLSEVVEVKKNFWFCFAPFSEAQYSNKDSLRKDLESLETFVFYCLKGKTTSKAHQHNKKSTSNKNNCPKISVNFSIIDNTNNSNIFKKLEYTDGSELIFPHSGFWGY
jgi:hypothetical protein